METRIEGRTVSFGGFLNERTDLAPAREALERARTAASGGRIVVDFSKIEKANSVGILGYIKLQKELALAILYVNVPTWLVEQFNIVQEFFDGDVLVESLFARFYCPDTDAMCTRLLKVGTEVPLLDDYSGLDLRFAGEDGHTWEPDFDAPSYFDFIARNIDRFRTITK